MSDPTLQLRPWREEDIPALARLLGNPAVSRFLTPTFPQPYGEAEAQSFIQACLRDALPERAITVNHQLIGGIGARLSEEEAVIGYWLGEPFWGRRYMRQALALYLQDLPTLYPSLRRAVARVYDFNPASRAVLLHCGFHQTDTFSLLPARDGLEHPLLTFVRDWP